jgi:hypothetical protein
MANRRRWRNNKIKQFQEVAGSLQDFLTYLFIKPGSAFATVLHSPIKFVALTEGTQHLQGQFIGFVGHRTMASDPTPIILPQEKTWKWKTQRCSTNPTALEDYYKHDTTWRGKLWSPDLSEDDKEIQVPHLLSIPLILFSTIHAEGQPLVLHEIHALVVTLTSEAEDASMASQDWSLVSKLCLMAAQKETTNGNSLVALAVNTVTEGDEEYLGRWLEQWLDTTMGPRPMTSTSGMINQGMIGPQDVSQVSALMATEVGKGVALGLQSLAPLGQESITRKGGSELDEKGYTSRH